MRFTLATVLAFAASAMATPSSIPTDGFDVINTPAESEKVPAGKPYVVEWDKPAAKYADGKVYIQVLGGKDPQHLVPRVEKLATVDNSDMKYTWDVDASLGDDVMYGLRFVWEQDDQIVQFSKHFVIVKAEGGDSSSTAAQGTKTVTLSSTTPSSTSTSSTTTTTTTTEETTTETTTSTTTTVTTPAHNSTTHASTMTKTTSSVTGTVTTVPSGSPSSGAARVAGSVAVAGGLFAALFAL